MITINGSNQLLVQGENCVRDSKDIIEHYPNFKNRISGKKKYIKKSIDIPEELKDVYEVINKTGRSIDEICRKLKCNPKDIIPQLTILEMQGFIVQYPGKIFCKEVSKGDTHFC